ncbi:MAG: hypothetical protein U5L45_24285 [Saprospiraceae bacterium]|nr:hypothetical protein [Saprospiraceae bacterium]
MVHFSGFARKMNHIPPSMRAKQAGGKTVTKRHTKLNTLGTIGRKKWLVFGTINLDNEQRSIF